MERVAIFWDTDSCPLPVKLTGYEAINSIRGLAYSYGSATTFKVYLDSSDVPAARLQAIRHQFESSGLSLLEYTRGDEPATITHTMIADMLVFAMDHPTPATIILISGKSELAYPASLLRHRRYRIIIVAVSSNESLKSQASMVLDWDVIISQAAYEKPIPEISFGNFSSLAGEGSSKSSSESQDVGAIMNDVNRPGIIPRSTHAKSIGSASMPSRAPAPDSTGSRMQPPTASWRNLNPTLNLDSNPNLPANPTIFKPFQLRRLTSSIGESVVPPTGEDNGATLSEPSYLESIGPILPGATPSSNMANPYQPPHARLAYAPPFANFNDFSSDLFSRKRQGLDPGLSPMRIARALVATDETVTTSPPSEKTKIGSPPASPNWTTVSGPSSKQGNTAPSDESTPLALPSPKVFSLLVEQLEKLRLAGNFKPLRSLVGCELNKRVYAQAGVQGFSPYVALAERMGIVELGGIGGKAWIGLQANWRDAFNKDT